MENKTSTIIWHDNAIEKPEKDGKYFVSWHAVDRIDTMNYTTIGGWNTHIQENGEPSNTMIEDIEIFYWANPAEAEVPRKNLKQKVEYYYE